VLSKKLRNLSRNSLIIVNVSDKLGKFDYKNLSFRKFCKKYDHRYLSSSGLKNIKNGQYKYLLNSLNVDFEKQHKFGEKLKKALDNAREINIQTKLGTNLTLNLENRKAINNSGLYRQTGKGGNMPAGEVYVPPIEDHAHGTLVIDGSIRTWKKTILPTEPVKLEIEKGKITKIHKSQAANLLKDTFRNAARKVKYKERIKMVAELGIGTNKSAKVVGTTIIDEKSYGTAHIAFGSNAWMGGKIKTKSHFDQVFKDPIIRIDGRLFYF
jgi:leucyl aminopeptidase (aminopeptidase T)